MIVMGVIGIIVGILTIWMGNGWYQEAIAQTIAWLKEHNMTQHIGILCSGVCSVNFNVAGEVKDLVKIYEYLKNSKSRYRVSLDELGLPMFSRCFSLKSKVKQIIIS